MDDDSRPLLGLALAFAALAAVLAAGYAAYRVLMPHQGPGDAQFVRLATHPAKWSEQPGRSKKPEAAAAPRAPAAPRAAKAASAPEQGLELPFAIDLSRPVRITWPLDIGPDTAPGGEPERLCLRVRQGASELLTEGAGDALYAFRLARPARARVWFRARYCPDGVGKVECNNTFTLTIDDQRAVIVGNDNTRSRWAWHRGPSLNLGAGLHWARLALREDGPVADRLVLAPASARLSSRRLDAMAPAEPPALAGEREPLEPQRPIQPVECFALPTDSLVVGKGHRNEITVCAAWHERGGAGFEGEIGIESPTAPGLVARGGRRIACGPSQRFARRVVQLEFPPSTPRRAHAVVVTVADKGGKAVFREEITFVKPCAWAFLGPFKDTDKPSGGAGPRTRPLRDAALACDRSPMLLANRRDLKSLGLDAVPPGKGADECRWKIVDDGSCCDWTGAVDLRRVYGPAEGVFAYAVTWINSSTSLSRRIVSFQADDAAWLWMNGCFLVELPMDLPREANRLWTSGPLRRGPNPVVVKITQGRYYWAFRFGVVRWHWHGRRREVITGLEPAQWPAPR